MEEVIYLQSPGKSYGQPPWHGYPGSRDLSSTYLLSYNMRSEVGNPFEVWLCRKFTCVSLKVRVESAGEQRHRPKEQKKINESMNQ